MVIFYYHRAVRRSLRYTERNVTTDERLELLAERHQALSESVEITALRSNDVITAINKDAENIRALARVAELHQARIERLEERQT